MTDIYNCSEDIFIRMKAAKLMQDDKVVLLRNQQINQIYLDKVSTIEGSLKDINYDWDIGEDAYQSPLKKMRRNKNDDVERDIFSFFESKTKDFCKLVGSNIPQINQLKHDINEVYTKHLKIVHERTKEKDNTDQYSMVSLFSQHETSPQKGRLKPSYQRK